MRTHWWTALSAGLLILSSTHAEEATSTTNEQLKQALARYPDADVNHDGVLTLTEARAYEQQLRAQQTDRPANATGAGRAPAVTPDATNVAYGPNRRNVLDIWRAKSDQPAPVFVYLHGGGFTGGDKADYANGTLVQLMQLCLAQGITLVSAEYRLVVGDGAAAFPGPMLDGARVVQFLRSKAREWHLDPSRIAIGGGSAGGNIALWVALHDDLANPQAADPVLRASSRVACVIAWNGQTSNDPHVLRPLLGGPTTPHPALLPFYGVKTLAELETPALRQAEVEASAVTHASKDDPPVLLIYGSAMTPLPLPATTNMGVVIHHPAFGQLLKDQLDPLGVPCLLYYGSSQPPMPAGAELRFLKQYLRITP